MGFLVINKNTGKVVFDKIYVSEGRANSIIKQGLRRGNVNGFGEEELAVIPMPSERVLKTVAEGGSYSTVTYGGKLTLPPIEWD